jgi:hypothetical protein
MSIPEQAITEQLQPLPNRKNNRLLLFAACETALQPTLEIKAQHAQHPSKDTCQQTGMKTDAYTHLDTNTHATLKPKRG